MPADRNLELALRIKADFAQARESLSQLENELKQTGAAGERAGAGARSAGAGIASIGSGAGNASAGVRKTSSALDGLAERSKLARSAFADLRNILIAGFAVHEVADFTRGMVDANIAAQRIHFTLAQVFGDAGAKQQFEFVSKEAERLGLDLKTAAEGYANLAASAQGTGLQTKDLQKLFIGLSEAATVLHSSGQQVNSVMIQLAQGMSLGRLQMQDIRAIAQNLPGTMTLVSAAAKKMGLNFQEAMQTGGLPAIQFLGNFADVLHERFGKEAVLASDSLNSELNKLKTTLFQMQTEGGGFGDTFTEAIRNLNTQLNDPQLKQGIENLIIDLGKVVALFIKASAKVGTFVNDFGSGIGVMLARITTGVSNPDDALEEVQAQIRDTTAAIEKLKHELGSGAQVFNMDGHRLVRKDSAEDITRAQDALTKYENELGLFQKAEAKIKAQGGTFGLLAPPKTPPKPQAQTPALTLPPPAVANGKDQANALAAALKQLQDQILQLGSGALGPVTSIWNAYTKAVSDADAAAEKAIKAGGDASKITALKTQAETLAAGARTNALAKLHTQLQAQLAEATGDQATASRLKIEQQYGLMLTDMERHGDIAGAAIAKKLINVDLANSKLQDLQQQVNTALTNQARAEGEVQSEQAAGLITGYTARQKLLAIHQQTAAILEKLIPDFKAVAAAAGNPKAAAAVADLQAKIVELSRSTNELKTAFASGFESGLEQALEGIATQSMSVSDAFRTMANAILQSLAQVAARAIATKALLAIGFAGGGEVGAGFATGGYIIGPGTSTSDSIPARLSRGEFVQRAAAVDYYGVDFMRAMNALVVPRFAAGGSVDGLPARAPLPALADIGARSRTASQPVIVRNINVFDSEEAAQKIASTGTFETAVVNAVHQEQRQGQTGAGMSFSASALPVWPVPPDWAQPVTETLTWLTDYMTARNGARQKRQMRLAPRRQFRFSVQAFGAERRLIDALRFSLGTGQCLMPIWPDAQILNTALAAGSTTFACATPGRDFVAGGKVLFYADINRWEVADLQSFDALGLTLASGTVNAWPAGTWLYPLRKATLPDDAPLETRLTDALGSLTVTLDIAEPCDGTAIAPAATYRSAPVLESHFDESSALTNSYARSVLSVDVDTGPIARYDLPGIPFRSQEHSWRLQGRTQYANFRALLYWLRGRMGTLWVPSFAADLELAFDIGASDTTITVTWCGYTVLTPETANRRDIRIEILDGTVYYRRITAAVEAGANETLTLDAPLGSAVARSAVRDVSFMELMECASDEIQIDHLTDADGIVRSSMKWQAVKNDL